MGEDSGSPGAERPRGGDHQCVSGLDADPAREPAFAVRVDDRARAQRRHELGRRGGGEAPVEHRHGVAAFPDPDQGIYERPTAVEVEGYELWHPAG